MPKIQKSVRAAVLVALAGSTLLAVASQQATAEGTLPTVSLTATKSAATVTGANALSAGATRFVVSKATASKDLLFVALKPGITAKSFVAAAAKLHGPPTAIQSKGTFVYQPSLGKGVTSDTVVDLKAGIYVVLDISQKPKLVTSFTVAAATGTPATMPVPDATITLKNYKILSPTSIAGDAVVKVHNAGPSPHFLVAVPVKNAATAKQAEALLKAGKDKKADKLVAGRPAEFVGLISPNVDNTVTLPKLAPGVYVLACFYSDDTSMGKEHSMLGMENTITIR